MFIRFLVNSYQALDKMKRFWVALLVLMLSVICGLFFINASRSDPLGNFSTYADDTYIHLRFANNLANGWGIVWNKGEGPVEGSTSFVYLLMIAALEKIGIQPVWLLTYLCAFFVLLALLTTLVLLQKINPGHLVENLLSVTMLGLTPRLMIWASTGLEVTFYAFAFIACILAYILYRSTFLPPYIVGIAFAFTAYLRPEFVAIFGVTFLFDLFLHYWGGGRKYADSLMFAAAFLACYIPVFLWKWSYFGYPFPNTYYAKTGGGWIQVAAGIQYLLTNLKQTFFPSGLLGILFLFTLNRKSLYFYEQAYVLLVLLSSWGIVAMNGGDYMLKGRFLTPLFPPLFVLAGLGISSVLDRAKPYWKFLTYSGLLVFSAAVWWFEMPMTKEYENLPFPMARENKPKYIISTPEFVEIGKTLKGIAKPGDSIALVPIGAIGFHSGMIVYDMVGLVDPFIAHEPFEDKYIRDSWRPGHDKGDGDYILGLAPTYILLHDGLSNEPVPGVDEWALQYKSIDEIWNSEEFHSSYFFCPIRTKGWYINLYCRNNSSP